MRSVSNPQAVSHHYVIGLRKDGTGFQPKPRFRLSVIALVQICDVWTITTSLLPLSRRITLMARVGCFHHIGTFLLFAASILLLITTITAPVVSRIPILYVALGNSAAGQISYGTFGYCVGGG